MDIHLLGPVEASLDDQPVALGPPKQRAVLAMLALEANRTVPVDRIVEGLWSDRAPATAPKMVQLYISQLRKVMRGNGGEILTRGRGYELRLQADRIDAARFERLVAEAARANGRGNGEARQALSLWRGDPLADLAHEPFASAEIRRLEELRLEAAELAVDADLAAGRHTDVLPELRALIEQEPLRERFRAQQMLALYRCGRQAEALEAYRNARSALVEAVGLEPGPELRRLHEAILHQSSELDLPEAVGSPPELDTGTPLVGRAAELGWLRQQWARARAGDGRLVSIAGEPGIGKTRLVAELAAEVAGEGATVRCAAHPKEAAGVVAATERPTLLVVDGAGDRLEARRLPLRDRPVLVVTTAAQTTSPDALTLGPLDEDAIHAVAQLYGSGHGFIPVARLLAASGGVPRALHRAASEWAREEDEARLRAAAGRLAAERPVLRAAEDELASDIVKRQTARERADRGAATVSDGSVCPYKGLASFEVDDASVFFGREQLVAEMVARVTGTPLLGIVGPSGSGKSSLLKAGMLAALAAGVLPGSERWEQALLRPGAHPRRALEKALAEAPSGDRLVLAVDQFEEAFTTCRDEAERTAFVDALLAAVRDPERRTLVLVAVRADYYGRCAAYPELSRLLGAGHVLVGPMRSYELRRAIERPARAAGLLLERELTEALLSDLDGQPGALPLLSSSLLELWQRRDGPHLRLREFEQTGGVKGAVERLAEGAYARLAPGRRDVARRILLRLAGEGEGQAVVRRRVPLRELEAERDGDVAEVLRVLADARLVTLDQGGAEVAHEALLREWPRLRGWLEEDAEGRRLHRHLIAAASDWDAAGRDPAELYRGARAVAAAEWAQAHDAELNAVEREFVAASRTEAQREAERRRRANRRLRASLVGVAALLLLAVIAGGVALSERGAARDAALVADAQRLGAEAQTRDRLDHALLLARAGVDLDDSAATRGSLLSALQRNPATLGVLNADGWPLYAVAVSPDERLAAVGSEQGTVTVFDVATRRRVGRPYVLEDGYVGDLKFSPDGRTLAVAGAERVETPDGLVDLVDPRTGERRRRIALPPFPEPAIWVDVDVEFGPAGREVLLLQMHQFRNPGGPPSVLRSFDARTGARRGRLRVGRHSALGMTPTGDGRRLFVTSAEDDETYEIDASTLQVLRRHPVGDHAGSVSPDARWFALGSKAGRVRLLDLDSGRVRRFSGGHDAEMFRMAFVRDGRTLVTTAEAGPLIVWDVARGEARETLPVHESSVDGLHTAPDGRSVYSAGSDGRAIISDLAPDRRLDRAFDAGPPFMTKDGDQYPRGVAVSPDGGTLAITQADGRVHLIDARTLRRRASVRALRGFAAAVAFSPVGRLLAVTGAGGELALLDARTGRPIGELRGLRRTSQAIAFSPDGRLLAAAEASTPDEIGITDRTSARVRIWDLRSRKLTRASAPVSSPSIAFSPDSRRLAIATLNLGRTDIRDVSDGRLVARLPNADLVRSVAWAPDGELLATGEYNGKGQLWSTKSWKRVGPALEGHERRLLELEFSPDGSLLSSSGADGTVRLWDVATRRAVGSPLKVEEDNVFVATTLAPSGDRLFAVSSQRRAVSWNISPAAWKRHACRVAGRELTRREWEEALPDRPYRPVCATG